MSNHVCEALTFGTLKACGRCAMAWPIGAQGEAAPTCKKSSAEIKARLAVMGATVMEEAFRIESSQQALVRAGDRAEPYLPELRKASVLRAIDRLLAEIAEDTTIMDRLRNKNGK